MARTDGTKYYAYLIIYVDDVLAIEENPGFTISRMGRLLRIKEGSIEEPTHYLGANIRKWTSNEGGGSNSEAYAMGSEKYAKEAVRVCEVHMLQHNLKYPSTHRHGSNSPFSRADYRPELEDTNFCNEDLHQLYMQLIGMARWLCELGRVDILHETALLSQYMASPRTGHLDQLKNIFKYVKNHPKRCWLVFDPMSFDVHWVPIGNEVNLVERAEVMAEMYEGATDKEPYTMPPPRGIEIDINCFVDADHAGNSVTRRSYTGQLNLLRLAQSLLLYAQQLR